MAKGITVRCRCNVERTIDPNQVGPWRLRCKQCGDVLYDPKPPDLTAITAPPAEEDDEDSQFQRWLHGSAELQVMLSSSGQDTIRCERHPAQRVVAACSACSKMLCKFCLDRVDDNIYEGEDCQFVCSTCVAQVATQVDPNQGGLMSWFKRLFGG